MFSPPVFTGGVLPPGSGLDRPEDKLRQRGGRLGLYPSARGTSPVATGEKNQNCHAAGARRVVHRADGSLASLRERAMTNEEQFRALLRAAPNSAILAPKG